MIFLKNVNLTLLRKNVTLEKPFPFQVFVHYVQLWRKTICIWIKLVKQENGNLETKQSPNYHSAIQPTFQTQTETQTEPEAYRMHEQTEFCFIFG